MNQTQSINHPIDNSSLVRKALYANALFSGASGIIALLGAKALATFTGINAPIFFTILGIVLMIYAVDLIWFASRKTINRWFVWAAILMDIAWVIGSAAVLVFGWPPLTIAGRWTVALIAEVVAFIAILQFIGFRRLR